MNQSKRAVHESRPMLIFLYRKLFPDQIDFSLEPVDQLTFKKEMKENKTKKEICKIITVLCLFVCLSVIIPLPEKRLLPRIKMWRWAVQGVAKKTFVILGAKF